MTHIMVWRRMFGAGGFWHHGILADDNKVIHYAGMDGVKTLHNSYIMKTSFEEFQGSGNSEIHVVVYHPRDHPLLYDKDTIIKRAESRIGQGGYDLLYDNCESFARWCCCGREVSQQATGAVLGAIAGAASLLLGGGVLGGAITAAVIFKTWDRRCNPTVHDPDKGREEEDRDHPFGISQR